MKHLILTIIIQIYFVSIFNAQSLNFIKNIVAIEDDYGKQLALPSTFGQGEFTFQLWIKPDTSYPIGPTKSNINQLCNWDDEDIEPYQYGGWWFSGNFLLDGHNNGSFSEGTFSLQWYGAGRIRWHFGDGYNAANGDHWTLQAYPATSTNSLLDGDWHLISCLRRWVNSTDARIELWVDDMMLGDTITPLRTDMTSYWNDWVGWPQAGWFYGAEKQAAENYGPDQYEDYKGLLDDIRFYSRAKSSSEIIQDFNLSQIFSENLLIGFYKIDEGKGNYLVNKINCSDTINLINVQDWNPSDVPSLTQPLKGKYYLDESVCPNDSTFNRISTFFEFAEKVGISDTVTIVIKPKASPYVDSIIVNPITGNSDQVPIIIEGNDNIFEDLGQSCPLNVNLNSCLIIRNLEIK